MQSVVFGAQRVAFGTKPVIAFMAHMVVAFGTRPVVTFGTRPQEAAGRPRVSI